MSEVEGQFKFFVTYRKALKTDLDKLRDFVDTYLKDYFLPEEILADKLDRDLVILALNYNEDIIGIAIKSTLNHTLWNLLVHPEYRGRGIGKALVELTKPLKIRCKWNISTGNPTEFYEKLGYGKIGQPTYGVVRMDRKSKQKSIQMMTKGGKVPTIEECTNGDSTDKDSLQ